MSIPYTARIAAKIRRLTCRTSLPVGAAIFEECAMSPTNGNNFLALFVGLSGSSRNAASNASEIFSILAEVSAGIAYLMSSGLQAVLAARFFLAGVERLLVFLSIRRNILSKRCFLLPECSAERRCGFGTMYLA